MKRVVCLISLIGVFTSAFQFSVSATPATSRVSALELHGMQLLYAIDDDQFDFRDAYLTDNSASIPVGSFPRVGYYVELGSNWVWVSMDTFNADPSLVGVPQANSGIVETGTVVSNLNVESSHPNVTVGRGLTGIIEFWASNYNANGGGAFGSNNGLYDWKDSGGSTGNGHGSFQIFAFTNSGQTAAQTLFGISANGGAGIGDQPGHPPGNSPDWTFGPGTGTYTVRNLEIWVGDNQNAAPVIADLDGDAFIYTPGTDGEVAIDQGAVATVTDPLPIGENAWTNGTLNVQITQGRVDADDQLGLVDEGDAAGQISVVGSDVRYEGLSIGNLVGGTGGAALVVTFNGGASTPAVSALMDNVSYLNGNAGTSPLNRVLEVTLTDGDGLSSEVSEITISINAGGVAMTYVWEGDESNLFNVPGNWDGNAVPDANDTAIFRDAGAGSVDLGAGAVAGEIRFDGTGNFSLENGVLTVKAINQTASAQGSNQVVSEIEAVALVGTVAANRLALGHVNSTYTGVYTVQAGAVLQAHVHGADTSLGAARVDLDGGELDLRGVEDYLTNALFHYGYQPSPDPTNADLDLNNNGGLLGGSLDFGGDPTAGRGYVGRTFLTDGPAGRGLDFNSDTDFINTGVIDRLDQYANLFIGMLTVTAQNAGDWTFRRNSDDDAIGIWLDLNRNGIFESTTAGLGSNRGEQLQWDGDSGAKTVSLVEGDYLVAFTHREGGGSSNMDVRISNPVLTEAPLKPTDPDQNGIFGVNVRSIGPISNTVRLLSDARIVTDAQITVGHLDVTTAAALTVEGEGVGFSSSTLSGSVALVTTNAAPIELGATVGPGGITQRGNGEVRLLNQNFYEGPTVIEGGFMDLGQTGTLGTPGQGTTVHANASLRVSGGTHGEPLRLSGMGSDRIDGALNKMIGANVFWSGPLTVEDTARIYSFGNELFFDGGIDVLGTNLTVDAQNRVNVRVNGITGDANATLRFEGNDRTDLEIASPGFLGDIEVFNDGRLDVHRAGALGDTNGVTRVMGSNATVLLRNTGTHRENFEIEGDGRGFEGAIRLEIGDVIIDGDVTLTADATIVTRNNSNAELTILGHVRGGFNLTQRENATLVLTQDSDIAQFDLFAGGTVRIATAGGLGLTQRLVLQAGEKLEFDGVLNFDGTTLGAIGLDGGVLGSVSGATVLDIPVMLADDAPVIVEGDGDLVLLRAIGNGDLPNPVSGGLSIFGFHNNDQNLSMNLDQNGGMVNGTPPDPEGATNLSYFGTGLLIDGPGGRGLDFNTDQEWQDAGTIATNVADNYCNLFIGYLNVSAQNTGDWEFQRVADDDRMGIWLDLNTNGIFESTQPGLGSNRGEQLQWDGDSGTKVVSLAEGRYLFAVTHMEFGGGSGVHVQFKSPNMSLQGNIKPSDFAQSGIWEPLSGGLPTVQPENGVVKSGDGVLTLMGDNTINKDIVINGGMVVAAHNQALGTGTNITGVGGSLGVYGDITLTGKTLSLGGSGEGQPGTLVNVAGTNAFLGDVIVTEEPSLAFSIASAEGVLTVGSPGVHQLDLKGAQLGLRGAGDVVVESDIHNAADTVTLNTIRHYGYHARNNNAYLNLDGNGGMMGGGDPTSVNLYNGLAYLTDGPGGRGLDFDNDQDFHNTGAIDPSRVDNYSNLFLAELMVSPAEVGDWEFRRVADDDQMGIWLDLDRDGVFESAVAGLGTDRGEQLQWDNDSNVKVLDLGAGRYLFAVTHSEGAGGSQVHVEFKSPSMPTRTTINPADPAQDGMWVLDLPARNGVVKTGNGTVRMNGVNTYVGETHVLAGTLVVGAADALGAVSDPTVVTGGTLAFPSNTTYNTAETLLLEGTGATNRPGALVSLGGTTVVQAPTVVAARPFAELTSIGTGAGTFTVDMDVDLQRAALLIDGAGDTEFTGNLFGLGSGVPVLTYAQEVLSDAPVLYYQMEETSGTNVLNLGAVGTNFNGTVFDAAHTDLDVPGAFPALGSAAAFDDTATTGITTPFSLNVFSNKFAIEAWVLSPQGQNNRSGVAGQNDSYEFGMADASNIELWNPAAGAFQTPYPIGEWFHMVATGDGTNRYIYINGVGVVSNANTVADYGNSGFFFNIGGQGIQDGAGGANNGNAFNGSIDEVAVYDRNLSAADVLRHYNARQNLAPNNAVIKQGTGTLLLQGDSTYNAGTRVSAGVLMANGSSATGTGPVSVEEGAVLAGSGAADGTVTLDTRGELRPGASAGTLTVGGNLVFMNVSSLYHAELGGTGVGQSDLVDVAGNIAISNATLNLSLVSGYTPSVSDTITILQTSSGAVAGIFNNLADGARVSAAGEEFLINYSASTVTLSATGGRYVYAGPDAVNRRPDAPVSFDAAVLTVNDVLGAGAGPLMVTAVSPTGVDGGSVALSAGTVTYTPPNGFTGHDSFTYTVSDGLDTAVGLVTVRAVASTTGDPAVGVAAQLFVLPNGDYRVSFVGTPDAAYELQWTADLTPPASWTSLGTVQADALGNIEIDHVAPPEPVVYYRAIAR